MKYRRSLMLFIAMLFTLAFILILNRYLTEVKICQPVVIRVTGISETEAGQIGFLGNTPLGWVLKLKYANSLRWEFNSYGSFTNLKISGDPSLIKKISRLEIFIGNVKYTIINELKTRKNEEKDLIQYIDPSVSKTDILKSFLHWNIIRLLFIAVGTLTLIFLFRLANRKLAFRATLISLLTSFYLQIKSGHSNLISLLSDLYKLVYIFLFCFILIPVYIAWFFPKTDYPNIVEIQGDTWYYQIRGVNLAYGKGLRNTTFFEKYAFSHTDIHKSTEYEYFKDGENIDPLKQLCPPVYPIFLAIVYKTFGVSPRIARYIQLLLLIFVAAFLPLFGHCLWKGKGVLIGTVAGLFFLFKQYTQAGELMTESLQIFLIFILLFAFYFYNKRKSFLTSAFVGVLLAINLLVKGIIIFIPLFYFFYLFRNDNYRLSIFIRTKWLMLISFVFVVSLWTFHLNSINGCIEKVKEERELQELRKQYKEFVSFSESSGILSSQEFFNQLYELANRKTSEYNSDLQVIEENVVKNQILTEKQRIDSLNSIIKSFVEPLWEAPVAGIKILGHNYILHPDRFMLISSNPRRTLLEANCMRSINGDVIIDNNIKYTYDEHYDWSPIRRVVNFYWNNPQIIPIIFPNKLFRGFSAFPFFILLFVLVLFDFSVHLGHRIRICPAWWLILLAVVFILIIPIVVNNKTFFILCLITGTVAIVLSYPLKIKLIMFDVPFYLNMFILNFVLIAMIHFGLDRLNSIVNFIVILIALYYFSELIEKMISWNLKRQYIRPGS